MECWGDDPTVLEFHAGSARGPNLDLVNLAQLKLTVDFEFSCFLLVRILFGWDS